VIASRTRGMFERGFIVEVHRLVERYGSELRALRAVGYRQVVEGLAGALPGDEVERRVVTATQTYGRRQRNWFRSDPSVSERLTPSAALEPAVVERLRAHRES
jgi:tRNA dimethylallyltransferase